MDNREKIREEVVKILNNINSEILNYQGDNLVEDHIIDSFGIIELLAEIEDTFHIDIDPELYVEEHFISLDAIIAFVEGCV